MILAREVFGPLGGVVEIGAVNSTGTWDLADVSVGGFLARKRDEMSCLMAGIRSVCRFGDAEMAMADEVGWFRDYEVSAAHLLLWSGGLTGVPEPLEKMDEPAQVRRMCRMGADIQLTDLLQALITGAVAAGTEPHQGAPRIADILGIASNLADPTGRSTPALVFRMWRVAHLSPILRADSDAPVSGRAGFRAYDEALEELHSRRDGRHNLSP